jgi:inner membrane protein
MPVMALLSVVVVRVASRKPVHWVGAFFAALIAVASHLLLDLTNIYGIRLWLPFSGEWLRLDLTSVIDIWIWGALLLGIAGPFVARLVGSEVSSGTVREKHHGRGFAIFALAFLLLYNCGRGVLHARAVAALDSRLYGDAIPQRVAALPSPGNPFDWRGVVETSDFYEVEDVNLAREYDPARGMVFHKPDPNPALDAARHTVAIQEFLRFSQLPLWRVIPVSEPEDGQRVEVLDMRFGTPLVPGFLAGAVLDSKLHAVETFFTFGAARPR